MRQSFLQTPQGRQVNRSALPQVSRKTVWIVRLVLLGLFAIWVGGALYLHHQVQVDQAAVEKIRLESQRKEERSRREAAYQYQLQERTQQSSRVQNAVDGR